MKKSRNLIPLRYVSFLFEIRDENSILDNGWNIRSPFFINNFFISTPKMFLSCFRVGTFITQVRIICKLTHITYIIVTMWVSPSFSPVSVNPRILFNCRFYFRSHPWDVFIIASDNFTSGVIHGASLSLQVIILFGMCFPIMSKNVSVNTKHFSSPFKLENKSYQLSFKRSARISSISALL